MKKPSANPTGLGNPTKGWTVAGQRGDGPREPSTRLVGLYWFQAGDELFEGHLGLLLKFLAERFLALEVEGFSVPRKASETRQESSSSPTQIPRKGVESEFCHLPAHVTRDSGTAFPFGVLKILNLKDRILAPRTKLQKVIFLPPLACQPFLKVPALHFVFHYFKCRMQRPQLLRLRVRL